MDASREGKVAGASSPAMRRRGCGASGSWRHGPALPPDFQGEMHHARLSADGNLLVIEKDGTLHLLATATDRPVATCEGVNPAGICVNEVFSEDGTRLSLL